MLFSSKEKKLLLYSYNGDLANVRKILSRKPINVDATNREGVTALMAACDHNHLAVVEALLADGAYVNMANNKGWTSLMWACRNGFEQIVLTLLKNEADVKQANRFGSTALRSLINN